MDRGVYAVFQPVSRQGEKLGVIAPCESYALYAGGAFGTVSEFYVRPLHRASGVGIVLFTAVKTHGRARGWTRLEVTTRPLQVSLF